MEASSGKKSISSRIIRFWQDRQFLLIAILLLQFALFRLVLDISLSLAETPQAGAAGAALLPRDLGEVVYQSNPENPRQIYIIGVEHRDTLTRTNGMNTSKVQTEVYKIGEWLIRNKGIELLVPEGFFSKKSGAEVHAPPAVRPASEKPAPVYYAEIEKKLGDNSVYINAEMLLHKYYHLRTRQVEDAEIYNTVHQSLCDLSGSGGRSILYLKAELDYLQEKRVAVMLQKIPQVVAEEFFNRRIRREGAVFTIGVSHVAHILGYLEKDRIEVPPPAAPGCVGEAYSSDLLLRKENFGVTVIVPKKLADDDAVMKMTRLYKVVQECRKQGPNASSLAHALP